MCMMRGTGFIELYFSPQMFDEKRYAAAAEVLQWAEDNFDIAKGCRLFPHIPYRRNYSATLRRTISKTKANSARKK